MSTHRRREKLIMHMSTEECYIAQKGDRVLLHMVWPREGTRHERKREREKERERASIFNGLHLEKSSYWGPRGWGCLAPLSGGGSVLTTVGLHRAVHVRLRLSAVGDTSTNDIRCKALLSGYWYHFPISLAL
jgi:hypothetical protein